GADPIVVGLAFTLDHGAWSLTGDAHVEALQVGPVTVTDASLTFTAEGNGDDFGVTVGFAAAGATLFDGVTITGVAATLHGTEQLTLHADDVHAVIGDGVLEIDVPDVDVSIPGADGVVFAAGGPVQAKAPKLDDDLTVTITGLRIFEDGRFSATSVSVEQPEGIDQAIGLGGLIPVSVTALHLRFTNVDPDTNVVEDLSEFEVEVEGTVNLESLSGLGF